MQSVESIYVRLYTNYTYRRVRPAVCAGAGVPGANWEAEAGRNGKTLTLKAALPAGLCLGFTPRKPSRDLPPAPTRGCAGGTREGGGGSWPPAQPRRAPSEQSGTPAALPPPALPPSPANPLPRRGQSCRRCSSHGSPSRGTGPILPVAGGLCRPPARRERACPGAALHNSSDPGPGACGPLPRPGRAARGSGTRRCSVAAWPV